MCIINACASDASLIRLAPDSGLNLTGSKDPRPGSHLWCGRHTPIARHGHPGQAYRASLGNAMSDELDWNFVDEDDAKAEIRAAVEYLLRGTTGVARGDIVQDILAIIRDVANGQRPIRWPII